MALLARADDVPESRVAMRTQDAAAPGALFTKQVFGLSSSMMIARRSAGYHSQPHVHDCEQLNYIADGSITIYIGDEAYDLGTGDFLRVPPNEVHYAWNRSDADCLLFEVHTPGLDILPADAVVELLADGESRDAIVKVPNLWLDELPPAGGAGGR